MIYFNSGPSYIPEEVKRQAIEGIKNFLGTGVSILEISHRSQQYAELVAEIKERLRVIMELDDSYEILLLQGGASLQFAQIPYNFLDAQYPPYYFDTGSWSNKATKEAKKIGPVVVVQSEKKKGLLSLPGCLEIKKGEKPSYVHITTNETITGIQWKKINFLEKQSLVADMSSDILSQKDNFNQYDFMYAGAQKNLGIAGLTLVIVNKPFLEKQEQERATISQLSFRQIIEKEGIPNTPPVFAVFVFLQMLRWMETKGGLVFFDYQTKQKAKLIYDVIDKSTLYESFVSEESRSMVNVPFFIKDKAKENRFLEEAEKQGFFGIRGHRKTGGIRISLYNSISIEQVECFAQYMKAFIKKEI